MSALTTTEVAERCGVTYRRLDYWLREGLLEGPRGNGTGRDRAWTIAEVLRAQRMARYVRAGLTPAAAGKAASLNATEIPLDDGLVLVGKGAP